MHYKILVIIISVTIPYVNMVAQPVITNVSGSFIDKHIINITGSGFGEKLQGSPAKYDDFESGQLESSLGNGGWLISTNKGFDPVYSNDRTRSNSNISAKSHTQEAPSGENYQYRCAFGISKNDGIQEIYIDFWWNYNGPVNSPSCVKFVRLYPNPSSPFSGPPNTYIDFDCKPTNGLLNSDFITSQDGHNSKWIGDIWDWTKARNNWVHIQVYFKASDVGQENGSAKMWVGDGEKPINLVLNESNNLLTRTPTNPTIWHSFWIGNYLSTVEEGCNGASCEAPSTPVAIYYDNVYIDFTQARIEIGNSPTYNSCSQREIQIPSKWTNNTIDLQLNQGNLQNKDLYLFITSPNGDRNNQGFPVSFSDQNIIINPPKGIEINP